MQREALVIAVAGLLASCASTSADRLVAGDLTPATIDVTDAMGSPHPGDVAPDFTLPDQHGAPVSLSSRCFMRRTASFSVAVEVTDSS